MGTTPVLQWSGVPGAAGYQLELYDLSGLNTSVDVAGTSFAVASSSVFPSGLANATAYDWQVSALFEENGETVVGPADPAQEFVVSSPIPPTALSPTSPISTLVPNFQWSAVSGATSYILNVEDITGNTSIALADGVNVAGTSYSLSGALTDGHTYKWYVQAVDSAGDLSLPSQAAAFTASVVVPAPSLNGPSGTVTTTAPILSWSAVSGAVGYYLTITDTTKNSDVLTKAAVTGTTYGILAPLPQGDSYQWTVEAFDQWGDLSAPASPASFNIPVPPPPPATPSPSSTGGPLLSALPTFAWGPVSGATGYTIELDDITTGNAIVILPPTRVDGTSYTVDAALARGATYAWRVQAVTPYGSSDVAGPWSESVEFNVVSGAGMSVSGSEGTAILRTIATFGPVAAGESAADFTATIDWGDGSQSSGTVAESGTGYAVLGSHIYAAGGKFAITTTVNKGIDSAVLAGVAAITAPVQTGLPVATVEGETFGGPVAVFDAELGSADNPDVATVEIDWGDGETSAAAAPVVSFPGEPSEVIGTHTYKEAGSYGVTAVVEGRFGDATTFTDTAAVADAPLSGTGASVTATAGATFSGTVATFTDGNPAAKARDFTATIDWGDGTSDTVAPSSANGGGFQVTGSHLYAKTGAETITVVVHDAGGSAATIRSSATVANPQPLKLNEDVYVIGSGTITVSAANGVLANDSGSGQLTVTSSNVTGAEGGAFTFHADGSFTYTPPANSLGFDYAKYTAKDTAGHQGTATVYVLSQLPGENFVAGGVVWKFFEQVLHRDPAASDLAFFIPKLAAYSAGVLSADFFESDELLSQIITGFYQQYLSRAPQGNDLSFWEGKWRDYGGPELIIAQFASSQEFNALAGNPTGANPAGWITALYDRILNRAPLPGDLPFWQQQLAGGTTEGQVALDFVASKEAFGDDVNGWFNEYLGRTPTPAEQTQYVNQMLTGGSDREIEEAITNLPEYSASPPAAPPGSGVRLPDYLPQTAGNKSQISQEAAVRASDALFSMLGS